jgi:hypothetical protein
MVKAFGETFAEKSLEAIEIVRRESDVKYRFVIDTATMGA